MNTSKSLQWGLTSIKVISIILISSALAWELANLNVDLTDWQISPHLKWIFWVERPALLIHGIEAIIGGYYACLQGKQAFPYGVYTFWVGFVGLLELINPEKVS
ncbi:MAG: hypothetical protein F6K08_02255 [Okeania sp. SIO1H6]|nr:hypothetical protein [Okeania sp. SIO1H6]